MIKRDKQVTIAKQWLDPKSYVAMDGREVLAGEDWNARKFDLWQRANGQCEYMIPIPGGFERCRREGTIPAHIVPRYPKRDDRLSNLKLYCHRHDALMEKQAWRKTRFGEKGKPVKKRLRYEQS